MCANHVKTIIILHTRRPNCQKFCYALCFYVSADFFFVFWGAEKHIFHIVPFRPTRCVLKVFRCLEISNCVRNRNKSKNIIYVRSKLQLCQLEILKCQSSLINTVSFVISEFNRVATWIEDKTLILVRTFQIPKRKHWIHIQGQPMSM